MIEVYSKNVSVTTDELIPFNIVALRKGTTVLNSGSYEFIFNNCGVYQLTVSAVAEPTEETEDEVALSINLIKDGVEVPQAVSEVSTTGAAPLSFSTLVQINRNNTPNPCSTPVICSIKNTGEGATFSNVDVVITKLV